MSNQADLQGQAMIQNMPQKTGKSLEEWYGLIRTKKLEKYGEIMKMLKGDFGVISWVCQYDHSALPSASRRGPAGRRRFGCCPIQQKGRYEALVRQTDRRGSQVWQDVELTPKKSYVSLRRAKQFAIIQPSTKSRMDLGISISRTTSPAAC